MAVSPPLDKVAKIPSTLVNKLNVVILDLIINVSAKITNLEKEVNSIPISAGCNNLKLKSALDQLDSINRLIDTIKNLQTPLTSVLSSFKLITNIATAVKVGLLAIPLPVPAAVSEVVAAQNSTITNALGAVESINSVFSIIDTILNSVDRPLANIIQTISNICPDTEFNVSQNVANNINNVANNINNQINDEISQINQTLDELVERQTGIIVQYTDPRSQVFTNNIMPTPNLGKLGDYYIDTSTRTIYGPKPENTSWGNGQNY